jgi:DMSO/TMAO reductase YedYZ heme-binding membrane subunit
MMNYKRFFIATIAIFVFALIWNGIVHFVLLREADSILNSIGRQESQRNMFLSILVTVILIILFVWSYTRFARRGDIRDGLTHGLFFGLLAGTLVDLNQFVLYPIPASLAITWFVFGLIEFCIYGVLVSILYPIKDKKGD